LIPSVLVVVASVTVTELAVTLVIAGAWTCGGAAFFFEPATAGGLTVSSPQTTAVEKKREFFTAYFL